MPKLKASEEFAVGKHSIGWVDSDFKTRYGETEFETVSTVGQYQKLGKSMNDAQIEAELKPGLCTLGDVLAFLENPPEGTKDGWWNLFYVGAFVVDVYWGDDEWDVYAWHRRGSTWSTGGRVFSPATVSSDPMPSELESSDTLPKMITSVYKEEAIVINGYAFIGGQWYKKI